MAYEGYECLKVRVERGVAFVTIDHPPINLFDLPLMQEIDRIGRELEADGAVRVVVFDSADPDFFIAHADVGLIQRLPRLIGRARALEVILGCEDIPADLAERYGYLNRALPPGELGPFVERLAYRIASFSAEAIALAKRAVNAAELPTVEGLLEEADCFNHSLPTAAARRRMARFLELGGQTREAELALGGLVERLRE